MNKINPFWSWNDTSNKDAVKCFITETHEKYYEHFGDRFSKSLKGFFYQ